jgi:hypothetical protein
VPGLAARPRGGQRVTGVAQYRPRPVCPGELRAFAIQVLTIADDGIAAIDSFLQPELFGLFDLPPVLPSPAINP